MAEVVVVVILVGILAAAVLTTGKTPSPVQNSADIETIKAALRELQLRTMGNLPTATLSANATANTITIYDNGTQVSAYPLSGTTGNFAAAFNHIGQLQTNQSIPASIYIEPETGYIP
jgi:hypothetical protein